MSNTQTIDHIVHLTPPGSLHQTSEQFRDLGFTVIPGGVHAGGLTENNLVLLQDESYIELISFTHPPTHYPEGSLERSIREGHRWANKPPGWIDYAFLGNGAYEDSIARTINARAGANKVDLSYLPEEEGGRRRPDGLGLRWLITAPSGIDNTGILPFFCGDITSREQRVPSIPESNRQHPSTVEAVAYIQVLVSTELFPLTERRLTTVIGSNPTTPPTDVSTTAEWFLDNPADREAITPKHRPKLILQTPTSKEHHSFLSSLGSDIGIFEVAFFAQNLGGRSEVGSTPYGRIRWLQH